MTLKTYTVIGYYEDNGQVWADNCEAETPILAAAQAVCNMLAKNE